MRQAEALAKATTLIEALPWLASFHGATVVIKYGGNAMTEEHLREKFAADVVFLRYAGLRPVIVHGEARRSTRTSTCSASSPPSPQGSGSPPPRPCGSSGWSSSARSTATWSA